VRDTPPALDAKYQAMLLERSGEERLKMAGSMYAAARALVVASILDADPSASPAALRQALFLRFYGHEFDEPTRTRILARICAEAEGRARRRVSINWDDLEMALTWRSDEWESYLDLRTGEVRRRQAFALRDELEDDELSVDEVENGLAEGHLVHIEPPPSSVEYGWMTEFVSSVSDEGLRDRLAVVLDGRGAFRRFKNVLADHPAERERWFAFRDERLRSAAREWLAEHGIEPTSTPSRGRRGS